MSDFDPTRPLVMARFATVLGHNLAAGTPLSISTDVSGAGAMPEAMALRLWRKGAAVYAEDFRPTPVETPEQYAARLLAQRNGEAIDTDQPVADVPFAVVPADLDVTKDELHAIAGDEEIDVNASDSRPVLQRKILEARALRARLPDATVASE